MAAPTKKQFDLFVVGWVLMELAWGFPKLWAARKSMDSDAGNVSKTVAGAVQATH